MSFRLNLDFMRESKYLELWSPSFSHLLLYFCLRITSRNQRFYQIRVWASNLYSIITWLIRSTSTEIIWFSLFNSLIAFSKSKFTIPNTFMFQTFDSTFNSLSFSLKIYIFFPFTWIYFQEFSTIWRKSEWSSHGEFFLNEVGLQFYLFDLIEMW